MERIKEIIATAKVENLYPQFYPIQSVSTDPEIIMAGKPFLMFCSNNYLGLATHPKVVAAAGEALRKHGTGPGGSRLMCGNIDLLMEADQKLAAFVNKEDAITFPTGFMANLSVFHAMLDPFRGNLPCPANSSVIFADKYIHASLVDGCQMSSAQVVRYRHNDIKHLEKKLSGYPKEKRKMITTDGVFSMDGDLAPLVEIAKLAKEYNAFLMVDEAHAIGVIGPRGSGTANLMGIADKTDVIMGALDKALGSTGGFLAGSKELVEYFRVAARPYMFSSALPACLAAGAMAAIDICQSAEGDQLRKRLFENSDYIRKGITRIGATVMGQKEVAVLPLLVGDEATSVQVVHELHERGIVSVNVMWPAVPKGMARIRITPMVAHTKEHMDRLLNIVDDIYRKLRIEVNTKKVLGL